MGMEKDKGKGKGNARRVAAALPGPTSELIMRLVESCAVEPTVEMLLDRLEELGLEVRHGTVGALVLRLVNDGFLERRKQSVPYWSARARWQYGLTKKGTEYIENAECMRQTAGAGWSEASSAQGSKP